MLHFTKRIKTAGLILGIIWIQSCNFGSDACYSEPDPSAFKSVVGKWEYVGFCEGEANVLKCFDTTLVDTTKSEYSFTSDNFHYETASDNPYSFIYKYEISADKKQMYYFQLDRPIDPDTIAKMNIAKLDGEYLVVVYQPIFSGQKVTSELYRRIQE